MELVWPNFGKFRRERKLLERKVDNTTRRFVFYRVFFAFRQDFIVDEEIDEEAHQDRRAGEVRVGPIG